MILHIECPCCREVIQVELTATHPYNNYKSVEIVQVPDE